VAVIADGHYEAGFHSVEWDGRNTGGEPAGPGIYFTRLLADDLTATGKVVLLK